MVTDTEPPLQLRLATNSDSAGIIDLVALCFTEFPGCILDVDGEEPELRDPAGAFSAFWVLDQGGAIVGTIACKIHRRADGTRLELKKLYLDPKIRSGGWARKLVELVESFARDHDIRIVELWTDTRFENAHGLYAHLGYVKTGTVRDLNDKSETVEFYYLKDLAGG